MDAASPNWSSDDHKPSLDWPERDAQIDNAELVLLTQFPPHFLRHLDLLNDQGNFLTEADQPRFGSVR